MFQCMCMNQNTFFSLLHAVAVCRQAHLIALLNEWKASRLLECKFAWESLMFDDLTAISICLQPPLD